MPRRHQAADELIARWAHVEILTGGELGHAPRTTLARAAAGELTAGGDYRSQLPRDVLLPGLSEHGIVSRVLAGMGPVYKVTLEAVHVRPATETGKTLREIAAYLNTTTNTLNARLQRIKAALESATGDAW